MQFQRYHQQFFLCVWPVNNILFTSYELKCDPCVLLSGSGTKRGKEGGSGFSGGGSNVLTAKSPWRRSCSQLCTHIWYHFILQCFKRDFFFFWTESRMVFTPYHGTKVPQVSSREFSFLFLYGLPVSFNSLMFFFFYVVKIKPDCVLENLPCWD